MSGEINDSTRLVSVFMRHSERLRAYAQSSAFSENLDLALVLYNAFDPHVSDIADAFSEHFDSHGLEALIEEIENLFPAESLRAAELLAFRFQDVVGEIFKFLGACDADQLLELLDDDPGIAGVLNGLGIVREAYCSEGATLETFTSAVVASGVELHVLEAIGSHVRGLEAFRALRQRYGDRVSCSDSDDSSFPGSEGESSFVFGLGGSNSQEGCDSLSSSSEGSLLSFSLDNGSRWVLSDSDDGGGFVPS